METLKKILNEIEKSKIDNKRKEIMKKCICIGYELGLKDVINNLRGINK